MLLARALARVHQWENIFRCLYLCLCICLTCSCIGKSPPRRRSPGRCSTLLRPSPARTTPTIKRRTNIIFVSVCLFVLSLHFVFTFCSFSANCLLPSFVDDTDEWTWELTIVYKLKFFALRFWQSSISYKWQSGILLFLMTFFSFILLSSLDLPLCFINRCMSSRWGGDIWE